MPKGNTNETVYASFHFLEKGLRKEDGTFTPADFKSTEYDALVSKIENQPVPDISDKDIFEAVKFGRIVPFYDCARIGDRLFHGKFDASYFGHAFRNSEKGKIAADTINQRVFHFLIYLSKSGRIYVGTQYLGLYGDFTGLKKALLRFLGLGSAVRSCVVRSDAVEMKGLVPTDVKVTLARASEDAAGKALLSSGSMVAFKADPTPEVSKQIHEKLFSLRGKPQKEIKKAVARLLNENDLYTVDEDDIENCVVVARKIKGRGSQTIYLFGDGPRATKFPLDVKLDEDGLPDATEAIAEMRRVLKEEVLSLLEDA